MHYHIINWNDKFGIIAALTYEDGAEAAVDFVDLLYNVFNHQLDPLEETNYIVSLVSMVDEGEEAHVAHTSPKISISWVACNENPCKFAVNN